MAYDVIVSGHLCADLLPDAANTPLSALSSPGKLFEVGPLTIATGGAVANAGVVLHRLGFNVGLMSAVGDDLLGQIIIAKLREHAPHFGDLIKVRAGDFSSYSIILSPDNVDRVILHCPGNNAHFDLPDIDFEVVRDAKVFYLGYPPLLPRLYAADGEALMQMYQRIRALGVITVLDMALPDPDKASGQANWTQVLRRTLPHVDIFLPSLEEIVQMLRRPDYDRWHGSVLSHITRDYLRDLADELLALGVTIAGLKLGAHGFYLKTADDPDAFRRFERIGLAASEWRGLDLWHPSFVVDVVGTVGAGDCAYSGFIAALLRGLPPQQALRFACAVGACNVESADATSGVRTWDETWARINRGWAINQLPSAAAT